MEIKNFYSFQSKLTSTTLQVHPLSLNQFERKETTLFDQHRLMMGDYEGITMPVEFRQEYGKELRDMLDSGSVSLFLISEALIDILVNEKISGWKTFPIRVSDKKGNLIVSYKGLSITGRCGRVDFSKSEKREKQLVQGALGLKLYKGLHVGLNQWDGNDMFLAKDHFAIIVTEKVKNIIYKSKLTNISFTNLEDIETPILDDLF